MATAGFANVLVSQNAKDGASSGGSSGNAFELRPTAFQNTQASNRPAVDQTGQVRVHLFGGLVTSPNVVLAGLEQDFIQFSELVGVGPLIDITRQSRKIISILSHAHFVKHLAQTVDIGLGNSRTFRRDEALRADKGFWISHVRHESNIRELRLAVYENDVRWLDVAMDEPAFMEI